MILMVEEGPEAAVDEGMDEDDAAAEEDDPKAIDDEEDDIEVDLAMFPQMSYK